MNPLLSLWLLVAVAMGLVMLLFSISDRYIAVIGNFWFIIAILIAGWLLFGFIGWLSKRAKKI